MTNIEGGKRTYLAVALIIISFAFHMMAFRDRVYFDISMPKRLMIALAAIVLIMPVHELIHWALMKLFGLKNVKIEITKDPLGFISLRTTAKGRVYGL